MNDISTDDIADGAGASAPAHAPSADKACARVLARLGTRQSIIAALGLTEFSEFTDEFWRIQCFTAMNRFYRMVALELGLDISIERTNQPETALVAIRERAEALLEQGLTYTQVRTWWLQQGGFIASQAIAARHEREHLASMRLVALVFFEGSRPRYLAFDANGVVQLVDDAAQARQFPVLRAAELEKPALFEAARQFDGLKGLLGATQVKLLPRRLDA